MSSGVIAAVLFDLDDTLIADSADTDRALVEMAQDFGAPEPSTEQVRSELAELWLDEGFGGQAAWRLGISATEALYMCSEVAGHPAMRGAAERYRIHAWSLLLPGVDAHPDAVTERFRLIRDREVTTFEDCLPALVALGQFSLGVVTNGPTDLQRMKLHASGVGVHCGATVSSGDLGVGKPRPEPILSVLEQLGVDPQSALMVGDNPSRDHAAALAAGVHSLVLDRGQPDRPAYRDENGTLTAANLHWAGALARTRRLDAVVEDPHLAEEDHQPAK